MEGDAVREGPRVASGGPSGGMPGGRRTRLRLLAGTLAGLTLAGSASIAVWATGARTPIAGYATCRTLGIGCPPTPALAPNAPSVPQRNSPGANRAAPPHPAPTPAPVRPASPVVARNNVTVLASEQPGPSGQAAGSQSAPVTPPGASRGNGHHGPAVHPAHPKPPGHGPGGHGNGAPAARPPVTVTLSAVVTAAVVPATTEHGASATAPGHAAGPPGNGASARAPGPPGNGASATAPGHAPGKPGNGEGAGRPQHG